MTRYLSPRIYTANLVEDKTGSPAPNYKLVSAREVQCQEKWLQNAIRQDPKLVIGPCEVAGLTEESWWFWAAEVDLKQGGKPDLLLLSESGRVAIVETKLHYNPEQKRKVLAQVLDYAVTLREKKTRELPRLPDDAHVPEDLVQHRIQQGDFLLVIAGDQIDLNLIRLSKAMLGNHMTNEWQLALIEVAIFQRTEGSGPRHLVVPHLRGTVETEVRKIVKLDPDTGRLKAIDPPAPEPLRRESWTREQFEQALEACPLGDSFKRFGRGLLALGDSLEASRNVELHFGTHKSGQVCLKRKGHALVYFSLDGLASLSPGKVVPALGEKAAARYIADLHQAFPDDIASEPSPKTWPTLHSQRSRDSVEEWVPILERAIQTAD